MANYQWMNVNSGQVGHVNSLWLLSNHQIAGSVVKNFLSVQWRGGAAFGGFKFPGSFSGTTNGS